ncbi:unnamed protein product [Laminaria digitata]
MLRVGVDKNGFPSRKVAFLSWCNGDKNETCTMVCASCEENSGNCTGGGSREAIVQSAVVQVKAGRRYYFGWSCRHSWECCVHPFLLSFSTICSETTVSYVQRLKIARVRRVPCAILAHIVLITDPR